MCEYCENRKEILKFSQIQKGKNDVAVKITKSTVPDGRTLYFLSTTLNGDGVSTEIKICPMCGRSLTEENNIEMKPVIHAHAIIDWLGNCKCSNCGNIDLNHTEPYCQHCGATLDETEERED